MRYYIIIRQIIAIVVKKRRHYDMIWYDDVDNIYIYLKNDYKKFNNF